MTKSKHTTFAACWRRYQDARAKCRVLSGDKLNSAQDEERDAIFDLAASGTVDPKSIVKKQKIAIDLQREGPWLDGRDVRLLESIRRDVQAMA
jgi:hypothetical protein